MPRWVRRLGLTLLALFKFSLALAIGFGLVGIAANLYGRGMATQALPLTVSVGLAASLEVFVTSIILRLVVSRFSLSLVLAFAARRRKRSQPTQPKSSLPLDFIQRAQDTYFTRFQDAVTLKTLIGQLVDPSSFFDRITERAELLPASQERIVKFNYRRVKDSPVLLIPLLEQAKGGLVDELDLEIDGSASITLPFLENQGAMLAAILALFDDAIAHTAPGTAEIRAAVSELVASTIPKSPEVVLRRLARLKRQNLVRNEVTYQVLRRLVEVCGQNFFILGVLEPGDRERVKIQITTRLSTGLGHRPYRDSPRVALGLRPREYSFQLRRSIGTPSYHFSMRTPRGMYIFDRWFESISFGGSASQGVRTSDDLAADYLISPSTKYLHAYIRNAAYDAAVIPAIRVQLRERPPGLMEVTSGLSALLALSVWFVGRFHEVVFPLQVVAGSAMSRPASAAWTTILFSIPTLLVGWLITRIDGGSLARTSIRSLGMVGWLAVNSFAAVLAAGFKTSGAELTPEVTHTWPRVTISHPIWAAVMMSSVIHVALSFVFVFARALRYTLALTGLTYRYGRSGIRSGNK